MREVPARAGKSQLCSTSARSGGVQLQIENRSFVATSGARKVQFYELKNTVCAVGLIASPIGLYRKMFSLIIFLLFAQSDVHSGSWALSGFFAGPTKC